MQIRPQTAAMLGYNGGVTGLFDPNTNVRFGVKYLGRAWQLAQGDLCRTLMKYRAGWGEERMTPLSIEYCRRARLHLAAIGSPLGNGAAPSAEVSTSSADPVPIRGHSRGEAQDQADRVRVASLGPVQIPLLRSVGPPTTEAAFRRELKLARRQVRLSTRTPADTQRYWAAHEARIREIKANLRLRPPINGGAG
jgi:hypothetical protein